MILLGSLCLGTFAFPERVVAARHDGRHRVELIAELELPPSVQLGDTVPIRVRVKNPGRQPVDLTFRGVEPQLDVIVTTVDGREVWRRLRGAFGTAMLGVRSLAPGEVVELAARWPQIDNVGAPVAAGTYQVRGLMPTDDRPLMTPARDLVITP